MLSFFRNTVLRVSILLLALASVLSIIGATPAHAAQQVQQTAEQSQLARDAFGVIFDYCAYCHYPESMITEAVDAMDYIEDRDLLVALERVIPGEPKNSSLYLRVIEGVMPPPEEGDPPTEEEIEMLRKWIEAGAPDWAEETTEIAETLEPTSSDLEVEKEIQHRIMGYVSLIVLVGLMLFGNMIFFIIKAGSN